MKSQMTHSGSLFLLKFDARTTGAFDNLHFQIEMVGPPNGRPENSTSFCYSKREIINWMGVCVFVPLFHNSSENVFDLMRRSRSSIQIIMVGLCVDERRQ